MAVKSVFAPNKNMLLTACSFTFNAWLCCHTFSLAARNYIGQGHTLLNVSTFFNPLTPMSDQEKTSPYNLSTISSRKVMRIK